MLHLCATLGMGRFASLQKQLITLVALRASVTRSFFSCTSTSLAPPTLITAMPPLSFASRSCSFSLQVGPLNQPSMHPSSCALSAREDTRDLCKRSGSTIGTEAVPEKQVD